MEEYRAIFDGPLLRRDPGQPPGRAGERRTPSWSTWPSELGLPLVATNDCHYLEPRRRRGARGAALHPDRQDLQRPERAGSFGTDQLYVEDARRDARRVRRAARGDRQHRRHRRALRLRAAASGSTSSRSSPTPDERDASRTMLEREARAGLEDAAGACCASTTSWTRAPKQAEYRERLDDRARRSSRAWASPATS